MQRGWCFVCQVNEPDETLTPLLHSLAVVKPQHLVICTPNKVVEDAVKATHQQLLGLPETTIHWTTQVDWYPDNAYLLLHAPGCASFSKEDCMQLVEGDKKASACCGLTGKPELSAIHGSAISGRLYETEGGGLFGYSMVVALLMWQWYCALCTRLFASHRSTMLRTQLRYVSYNQSSLQVIEKGWTAPFTSYLHRYWNSKSYLVIPNKQWSGRQVLQWLVHRRLARGVVGWTLFFIIYWLVCGVSLWNVAALLLSLSLGVQIPLTPLLVPFVSFGWHVAAAVAVTIFALAMHFSPDRQNKGSSSFYPLLLVVTWLYILGNAALIAYSSAYATVPIINNIPMLHLPGMSLQLQLSLMACHMLMTFLVSRWLLKSSRIGLYALMQPFAIMALPFVMFNDIVNQ